MNITNKYIHPTADVQCSTIGEETHVWQYSIILPKAVVGNNCNINCYCFIENDVIIGNSVTIKSGVYIWDGIRIGNNVFIGPNVTFINDKYPRSKEYPNTFLTTIIEDGVSIGAGSVIMGGITIGSNSLIGAGSLVLKSVPSNSMCYGSPAKVSDSTLINKKSTLYYEENKFNNISKDNNIRQPYTINIQTILDKRGNISIVEETLNIPFNIRRIFYIWNNNTNHPRGGHAHKKLFQGLIAVNGSCCVSVDDGKIKKEYNLNNPATCLVIPPGFWGEQYDFTPDCVLLVIASDFYEESDYIRNYEEFLIWTSRD